MEEILSASDGAFQAKDSVPSRDALTFNNGFHVHCSAVFVDIVNSSKLNDDHSMPHLAKLYRSFISELVAIFNAIPECQEVNIHGDAVWAVFEARLQQNIDAAFTAAVMADTFINLLNCRSRRFGVPEIAAGVGCAYGRALMIKAGYKGSGINEVVYMGSVVNEASRLGNLAARGWGTPRILITDDIYNNLTKDDYKGFCSRWTKEWGIWGVDAHHSVTQEWINEHC